MDNNQKIALVRERFILRDDIYSEQWYTDGKGLGYNPATKNTVRKCPHTPRCPKRQCPDVQYLPITDDVIKQHLLGKKTIALFQLSEENTVKWLCLDVDIVKGVEIEEPQLRAQEHTQRLYKRFVELLGENATLIEDSGSKGYHLWVFFSEPVQARFAYTLGRFVESSVPPHDGINVEVYPKQTSTNSFGSMLKLPLGIHLKTNQRCFFLTTDFNVQEDQWSTLESVRRFTEKEIIDLLSKHNINTLPSIREDKTYLSVGFPCMGRVMREGLAEGTRDVGLFHLALYLKNREIPHDITENVLQQVNNKGTPVEADVITTKVDSAYSGDYRDFPCMHAAFDNYCSSSCKFWPKKIEERWMRYGKVRDEAVGRISRD